MILTSGERPPFEPETDVEEEIAKAPVLSREQEQMLLCQIKQGGAGGKAARTRLIEAHAHLAFRIARRYTSHTCVLEYHDLVQEGQIGLVRAVDSFDAGRRQRFSTYAARRIHRAIKRALAENRSANPLPDASWTASRTIQWTEQRLIQQQHQPPAEEELALATHLSVEWMHTLRSLHNMIDLCSLEQSSCSASEGESMLDPGAEEFTLGDLLCSDDSTEEKALTNLYSAMVSAVVEEILCPRERHVLLLRFGFQGRAHTLAELARDLNVSRERIRQIEWQALRKLRRPAVLARLSA